MIKRMFTLWSIVVAGGLLSACQADGPNDNALTQSFTWFSYLAGDDIRTRCAAGGPEALRFVYNGTWHQQVRTYDIRPGTGGRAGVIEARILGQGNLANLDLNDPARPWRGDRVDNPITPVEIRRLTDALGQASAGPKMRSGQFIRSDAFYWVATSCVEGVFRFAAWQMGDQDIRTLPFVPLLQAMDATGVPFSRVRDVPLGPFQRGEGPMHFQLQLGENGLRLTRRL